MKINAEKMTENTIFLDGDLQSSKYASGTWSTEITWLTLIAYFLWTPLIQLHNIVPFIRKWRELHCLTLLTLGVIKIHVFENMLKF